MMLNLGHYVTRVKAWTGSAWRKKLELLRTPNGLLALMAVRQIGPVGALKLATEFETWAELLDADPALRAELGGKAAAKLTSRSPVPEPAPQNVDVISIFDQRFPAALKTLLKPPPVIWVRGALPERSGLAVAGTRKPSSYGTARAAGIGALAQEFGVVVVSGLALGIDCSAQEACVERGGRSVAVLGSGVDVPTPRANARLCEQLLAAGGTVISEVAPGRPANKGSLLARNRLQVALSGAVLIVQSGSEGGSLTTAGEAIVQDRPLYVLKPDDAEAPSAWAGNADLLDPSGPSCLPETHAKHAVQGAPAAVEWSDEWFEQVKSQEAVVATNAAEVHVGGA